MDFFMTSYEDESLESICISWLFVFSISKNYTQRKGALSGINL